MKYFWMAVVALFVPMFLFAQDGECMKLRSSIYPQDMDAAIDNGFRAVHYVGQYTTSLLTFNAYGSTGPVQMETTFWGDLRFRNKRDNLVWTDWRTIYHTGNFNPVNHIGSLANTWNKDGTGRERFYFETVDSTAGNTTYIRGYGSTPLQIRNGDNVTVFQVGQNGELGVGTMNTHGHKLAVAGSILAEKVKVKQQSAWPDYVFRPGYVLRSLEDLERFVLQHHHLPDVPSEKEVKEHGVDVGEMNAKLLKTVEEQALYIIELNKQMKIMQQRLLALENQTVSPDK